MTTYLAPMEGITDHIYRDVWMKHYGGADFCVTPFLSPNQNHVLPEREFKHVDPKRNDVAKTIPQVLGNDVENIAWLMGELSRIGYTEVNLNLGCPSGTVTAKKKGSGWLRYPEELDRFLEGLINASQEYKIDFSVKTRIGFDDEYEWGELLEIFNKYPLKSLTVHPRITKDFYNGTPRMEAFDYAIANSKNPLIYNGDLRHKEDIDRIFTDYGAKENFSGIMIGRGLIVRPWLLCDEKSSGSTEKDTFKDFYHELYDRYKQELPGDTPLMHRMKEFWAMWGLRYETAEAQSLLKQIMKAKKVSDLDILTKKVLDI